MYMRVIKVAYQLHAELVHLIGIFPAESGQVRCPGAADGSEVSHPDLRKEIKYMQPAKDGHPC
jgi:hypothetical protein